MSAGGVGSVAVPVAPVAGSFVLDVPSTDPVVLGVVLEAIGPHLGQAAVTTGPGAGGLAATGTAVTVTFDGEGWLDGVAVVAAAVASDHVADVSVAWAGADGLVRTSTPGPWTDTPGPCSDLE